MTPEGVKQSQAKYLDWANRASWISNTLASLASFSSTTAGSIVMPSIGLNTSYQFSFDATGSNCCASASVHMKCLGMLTGCPCHHTPRRYAGLEPNVIALDACASFCAIEMGIWIHDFKKRRGWDLDVIVGTALVDIYGRCGRIEEGLRLFQGMKEKIELTPNADIKGLALGKRGEEAVWVVLMKWSNKGIML
ncbi:hypothetical protein Patl1_01040 [Pistacia atlantica]|uniref:Uncharacterized protein n=1 Tax=Pistacia atlantica TaxID=434234 RepID=A0ACC1C675_9ROSI|nr:hypothetical protein Patl1_01040 [Pistacia atlantica]